MSQFTPTKEGEVDYDVPAAGKPCKTWYKIIGDLDDPNHKRPIVSLHGGPGGTHAYQIPLGRVWETLRVPVVLYDQIGNGNSTHLPEKNGDHSFWTEELFRKELENLLRQLKIDDDYDLIGQSWGGMLGASFATYQPKGLKRLIITDAPASMDLWGESWNRIRLTFPEDIQATLSKHEKDGTFDSKDYQEATLYAYQRHFCRLDPWPQELVEGLETMNADNTVYMTMNGPNEFLTLGSLKGWSVIDRLHLIEIPVLLINGRYDPADDEAVFPYFSIIEKCKWVRFDSSAHLPQLEEPDRYFKVVEEFLMHVQP